LAFVLVDIGYTLLRYEDNSGNGYSLFPCVLDYCTGVSPRCYNLLALRRVESYILALVLLVCDKYSVLFRGSFSQKTFPPSLGASLRDILEITDKSSLLELF